MIESSVLSDISVNSQVAEDLLGRLFPICRSITGNGVRQSLQILREYAPELQIHEYPSGTQVYDWRIPKEWNIRDAYIKDKEGQRLVDFQKSNLHVMSYSVPVQGSFSFEDLKPRLHSLPLLAEAIPYRTSYYKEDWAFCVRDSQLADFDPKGEYEVCIDSELKKGSLTLADALLRGTSGVQEYLISTYCCHPSLANDNLSGLVLTVLLFNELKKRKLRHNYRFVIAPETIGAISYLAHNEKAMRNIKGGFVITTVAGPGKYGYKQTFLGNHAIDRVIRQSFQEKGLDYISYPFVPNGSDERQYSSPGFRIPMATICKDKYYEYEYYHTSLDDLDFIKVEYLLQSLELYLSAIEKLEEEQIYRSLFPCGEVQLGKRGLYPKTGGALHQQALSKEKQNGKAPAFDPDPIDSLSWFLFLCDGEHSLGDISEKSQVPKEYLETLADQLLEKGVIISE